MLPLLSPYFNLTVEMPLKAIVRGYSYAVVPISWITCCMYGWSATSLGVITCGARRRSPNLEPPRGMRRLFHLPQISWQHAREAQLQVDPDPGERIAEHANFLAFAKRPRAVVHWNFEWPVALAE